MKRTPVSELPNLIGQSVMLAGWIHRRRNLGKLVFFDLRDRSGIVQIIVKDPALLERVSEVRPEWVAKIIGEVKERNEKDRNSKEPTGMVEIIASSVEILNSSKTPPFEIENEDRQANEELRLKYRYLDLRHERLKQNLILRHETFLFLRNYLARAGFLDIETPILTKGTPEGAREFLVPSRVAPGKFYVLPQSPQQFKQLLQVAGIEKYMQIARCFRDEDQRGDRQPEFSQLDLELSFVEAEDIHHLTEGLLIKLIEHLNEKYNGRYHLTRTPFFRLGYADALATYQSDKPDLRVDKNDPRELAFVWIVNFPLFEYSETDKKLVATHHLFTSPHKDDILLLDSAPERVRANQYDLVLNGYEIGGGSIRIHQRDLQQKIFDILKIPREEAQRRFGHMLEAFEYGAPPHGGIALGLDRLVMLLANELNIREVIAFPKTSDARDPMMGAPSSIPPAQLQEVHITVETPNSKSQ